MLSSCSFKIWFYLCSLMAYSDNLPSLLLPFPYLSRYLSVEFSWILVLFLITSSILMRKLASFIFITSKELDFLNCSNKSYNSFHSLDCLLIKFSNLILAILTKLSSSYCIPFCCSSLCSVLTLGTNFFSFCWFNILSTFSNCTFELGLWAILLE